MMSPKRDAELRQAVEAVVEELFRSGAGPMADRLLLVHDLGPSVPGERPNVRDLGGWCRQAVFDVIYKRMEVYDLLANGIFTAPLPPRSDCYGPGERGTD